MRGTAFASSFLFFSSFALAHGPHAINLDQPGVLDQLKQQHPQRYQAVNALLRAAQQAPCPGKELDVLKTRFNFRDLECGMLLFTSYPAKRQVSFELDGTDYVATVALKNDDKLQPISSATGTR